MAGSFAYKVSIGGQTASSKAQDNERLLLSLQASLAMGCAGACELWLGDAENTPPETGDPLSVELDAGAGARRVFTGFVDAVSIDATGQRVTAFDGLRRLAGLQAEASYQDVDVDFVVKDLLRQAGVEAGRVAKGFRLSALALAKGPSALGQVLRLADWCGADLYTDGAGKAHFTTPAEQGAEHAFQFAGNVLRLEIQAAPPVHDSLEVFGEGAAAGQGADKFYWLARDLAGVSGKAALDDQGAVRKGRLGQRPLRLKLGAVRTGEAAQQVAEARLGAWAARWLRGCLEVSAAPGVLPGDLVKIEGLPARHGAAGLLSGPHRLRVRRVAHRLSRGGGFTTRLDF